MKNTFDDATVLITGGTGSFGHAVTRRFLNIKVREIRVFSRDEKKQDDMRKRYLDPRLKFYIGDVRDLSSVAAAMRGVDYIFHAAALKQVPSCEFHPMQAVMTNVLGTQNVLEAAIAAGVQRVVCLSTDKAVYPINAMGISKAMMEKVMIAASRNLEGTNTVICGTRYGNVMASRGSVIPLFVNQVRSGMPITLTDPAMTRFMMTLDDAVDLVLLQNLANHAVERQTDTEGNQGLGDTRRFARGPGATLEEQLDDRLGEHGDDRAGRQEQEDDQFRTVGQ
jgi:UDP-glucose 4-epimerase